MFQLLFYRRVGQPPLTLDEVDAALRGMPGFRRQPAEPGEPALYLHEGPAGEVGFALSFEGPVDGEEDPGRADFPYEVTPLTLQWFSDVPPPSPGAALSVVAALCRELDLLVLDPQLGQEIPGPPDVDALMRSYAAHSEAIAETLEYMRGFRRRLLVRAALILACAVLLSFVLHWFRR